MARSSRGSNTPIRRSSRTRRPSARSQSIWPTECSSAGKNQRRHWPRPPRPSRRSSTAPSTEPPFSSVTMSTIAHREAAPGGLLSRLSLAQKQLIWAWSFLAIPILFYAIIRFWPTFQAFYLSVTDWNIMRPATFVGLANYKRLLGDALFWQVFRNTALYLILGTPISLLISFVVAYYLDRVRFMHSLIRALYFLPFLTT